VRGRICLVGVALSVSPLTFGVTAATAAKSKSAPPTTSRVKVTCTTNVGIMIAPGDTGVLPPAAQGTEYGTVQCGKLLGQGVQADTFTLAAGGDTLAHYKLYFGSGTIHGSYDLTPQESDFNFLETDYLGKLTIAGGTGAFQGLKGTGTMTCQTLDGIHTTCKLKLKLPTNF